MTRKSFNLALIQTAATENPDENINHTFELIRNAAGQGANVICLQELFHTTYFCAEQKEEYFSWAEAVPGPLTKRCARLAGELGVILLVPVFEKAAPGVFFNTMAVLDADGSYLGKYRKMHIPEDPGFHEKFYFTPGDLGYKVFDTKYCNIGTLICWDQWFPEAARLTALKGAELLIYPTAIGMLHTETTDDKEHFLDAWKTVQRSHAIANGCFVAGVNRTGTEKASSFWGNSFVAGPFGEILSEAGDSEEILLTTIDPGKMDSQRQTWPFLRDRRIDSYEGITKRIDTSFQD